MRDQNGDDIFAKTTTKKHFLVLHLIKIITEFQLPIGTRELASSVQGRGRCSLVVYSITMEDAEQQQNEAEVRSSRPGKATRAAQAKKEADQRRALNTIIDMVESRLNTGPKNGSGLRWEDEVSAGAFDETSLAQYCKMSVGTPIIHLFIQFFRISPCNTLSHTHLFCTFFFLMEQESRRAFAASSPRRRSRRAQIRGSHRRCQRGVQPCAECGSR